MGDGLTLDVYRGVVESFYGFVEPLERALWSSSELESEGMLKSSRGKTNLLERDLVALGHTSDSILALPRTDSLPPTDNVSRALGAMYVLEGSTLGGQVIRRHLARTLGIDDESGAAYFNGYGTLTRQRWIEYLQVLNAGEDKLYHADVVLAASTTFSLLRSWLCHSRKVLTPI